MILWLLIRPGPTRMEARAIDQKIPNMLSKFYESGREPWSHFVAKWGFFVLNEEFSLKPERNVVEFHRYFMIFALELPYTTPFMFLKYTSYRTSKGRLLRLLKPMPGNQFSSYINPIISQKRGLDPERAKHKQFLQSNEVIAFLEKIGEPLDGFGREIRIGRQQMDKSGLRRLFPTISAPEFSKVLTRVVAKNRRLRHSDCVRKRYLLPREIKAFLNEIGEVLPDSTD